MSLTALYLCYYWQPLDEDYSLVLKSNKIDTCVYVNVSLMSVNIGRMYVCKFMFIVYIFCILPAMLPKLFYNTKSNYGGDLVE